MKSTRPDHYSTLGLHQRCTDAQIRAAYRALAKQHHPDVNDGSREALAHTQKLNAAYETLSDAERRAAYDAELAESKKTSAPKRSGNLSSNVTKEVHLRLEDFLRGTRLEVCVKDPANPTDIETYELIVPPDTAPGTRFKLPRTAPFERGFVSVQVKARPDFRFKPRGADLRYDLKIKPERASQGGTEMIRGITGAMLRVPIPPGVGRNEIIRLPNEGLPKPRGGRGDLLVRIRYRIDVRIRRPGK